jgi:hypothetical protein
MRRFCLTLFAVLALFSVSMQEGTAFAADGTQWVIGSPPWQAPNPTLGIFVITGDYPAGDSVSVYLAFSANGSTYTTWASPVGATVSSGGVAEASFPATSCTLDGLLPTNAKWVVAYIHDNTLNQWFDSVTYFAPAAVAGC